MHVIIRTHNKVGRLRRVVNRLAGLPSRTCHVEVRPESRSRWRATPLAVCKTCGSLHIAIKKEG